MDKMKIRGGRSYVIIEVGKNEIRIDGELTITPAFYAEAESIKYWKTPKGLVSISEEERDRLILQIIEETKNAKVPILFDGYNA